MTIILDLTGPGMMRNASQQSVCFLYALLFHHSAPLPHQLKRMDISLSCCPLHFAQSFGPQRGKGA